MVFDIDGRLMDKIECNNYDWISKEVIYLVSLSWNLGYFSIVVVVVLNIIYLLIDLFFKEFC